VAAIVAVALRPQVVEVDAAHVKRGDLLVTIDEEGETRVRQRFVVAAPVAGRLQRIELEPGDRVRRGKPHPEPYRRAFQRLGVKPAQAVVVENAPYGIRAARRAHAGLVIALASSLPNTFLREAHIVVSSIPQLCKLLDRLVA